MFKKIFFMGFFFLALTNSIYAQSWTQVNIDGFGDANNVGIMVGTEFNNCIYAVTGNENSGCEVWKHCGSTWTRVDPGAAGPGNGGFGDANNSGPCGMGTYNNKLYVGTENDATGCEVWEYNGSTWTQINANGFGNANNSEANGLVEYNGYLYVSTSNKNTGCEVWEYNGTTWTRKDPGSPGNGGFGDGSSQSDARGMVVCNGSLNIGTENDISGCEVWAYNGTIWSQINAGGFGDVNNEEAIGMTCYNNTLYVGVETADQTGAGVWKYSGGTSWTQINTDGFGNENNFIAHNMIVHNTYLYVGTLNEVSGGEMWRYDGPTWSQEVDGGFGDGNNVLIYLGFVFNDSLYAGTINEVSGGEVWTNETSSIPTVSEWGMLIFFILLVGSALWVIRGRTIRKSE